MGLLKSLVVNTRPLLLRELIYKAFLRRSAARRTEFFNNVRLAYAPEVEMDLCPTDVGHQWIAYCGYGEKEVTERLAQLADRGGVLVDVGANYGYYSLLWTARRARNVAYAFEASPAVYSHLCENVQRSKASQRIQLLNVAAGQVTGRMSFDVGPASQTGWGGLTIGGGENRIEVEVATLDEFAESAGLAVIDALKIDTEGADTWVLMGASGLLQSGRIASVFFEENPVRMDALGIERGSAQRLLAGYGYGVRQVGEMEWYAAVED